MFIARYLLKEEIFFSIKRIVLNLASHAYSIFLYILEYPLEAVYKRQILQNQDGTTKK
jgi:hypothetical protein